MSKYRVKVPIIGFIEIETEIDDYTDDSMLLEQAADEINHRLDMFSFDDYRIEYVMHAREFDKKYNVINDSRDMRFDFEVKELDEDEEEEDEEDGD